MADRLIFKNPPVPSKGQLGNTIRLLARNGLAHFNNSEGFFEIDWKAVMQDPLIRGFGEKRKSLIMDLYRRSTKSVHLEIQTGDPENILRGIFE